MADIPLRRSPLSLPPQALGFDTSPFEKRVGLIVLSTDHTSEADFRRMVASEHVGLYISRIGWANPVTPENLRRMQPRLTEGAALLLPDEPFDAVCYSCTSASVVIGDAAVEAAIAVGKPGTPVVTPPGAARQGFAALGVRRISILTPYTEATSAPMARYFAEGATGSPGLDVLGLTCFGLEDDREMARVNQRTLVKAAIEATAPEAEALFISCTALRAAEIVPEIEAAIGRPVISSNLASAWVCLRLCGETTPQPALGRLMGLAS